MLLTKFVTARDELRKQSSQNKTFKGKLNKVLKNTYKPQAVNICCYIKQQ